jgi:Matrixin
MGPGTESARNTIKKKRVHGAILAASLIVFGTWASAQNTRELSTAGNAALGPTATDKPPIPKQNMTPSSPSSPKRVNWSTPDKPCANYNDLKKYDLGDIGVKIDVSDPAWAAAFRRALVFWNKVLDVNFYEEKNINACGLRITDGPLVMFGGGFTAFAQFADLDGFEAKIVVLPQVPLSPAGKFVNAVHEIGHIVDLKHNPDPKSVMYPFIENSSKLRQFANAVQYRVSHLRHILEPKPVLCRYIASVYKARLDKDDLATLSRNHLMRDGTVPPVKSERAQTEVFGLSRPQAASTR